MLKLIGVFTKLVLALALLLILLVAGAVLFMPGIHISSVKMMLNVMTGAGGDTPAEQLMQRLQVADDYSVSIFASGIQNPRMMQRDAAGRVLISSPRSGEIMLFEDSDGDGFADLSSALMQGLSRPHGLDIYSGYLYVAEFNQVGRIRYNAATGATEGDYEVVVDGLTGEGNHWSKTLRFDAEGWMYVAMGSTCNVCEETDQRRATIMRYRADGSEGRIWASGLRNSVGMDFAPWNGALYATDNGRDLMGDDYPPCELNQIEEGGFYGWPYLNGSNDKDPDFGELGLDLQATAIEPVYDFAAHNAPLGIHFSSTQSRSALVALHGSWNRSQPDGYKVLKLSWDATGAISESDFMWGFEDDGNIVGRPVDIIGDGAGGYFVSDDYARVIYRLSPRELKGAPAELANTPSFEIPAHNSELAAAGAELYQSMPCASCHNPDAATPVALDRIAGRYSMQSLADYFLTPTAPMPLYDLNAEQREQLAHFLFSQLSAPAEK